MVFCCLFIYLTIIHSFIQTVHCASYYWRCELGSQVWRCTSSQSCGNSYGSCIGDKSKPLENHVVVIIIICVVTLIFTTGCSCYYRAYRRKQARTQLAQQIQVLTAQNQPPCVYYVNPNPPVTITSPIQEELPPTYEQSERQKVGI